jgi:hypothetical protein
VEAHEVSSKNSSSFTSPDLPTYALQPHCLLAPSTRCWRGSRNLALAAFHNNFSSATLPVTKFPSSSIVATTLPAGTLNALLERQPQARCR